MADARRHLAVIAALLSIAGGVLGILSATPPEGRTPRWAGIMAPLRDLPLPPGTRVALDLPGSSGPQRLLMESMWVRPDLRFGLEGSWPRGPAPEAIVSFATASEPPGWNVVWQASGWTLLRRSGE